MKTRYYTFTEQGRRDYQQDVCKVVTFLEKDNALFVICDGMGGLEYGDIAALTVCNAITSYWENNPSETDSESKVVAACQAAHKTMDKLADKSIHTEMGTTLVLASIKGNKATIAHCGDSRCYLLRENEVIYQTRDHTELYFGMELLSKCFLSYRPDMAQADVMQFEIRKGDRIFLCSDGVHKIMDSNTLTTLLMSNKTLEEIATKIEYFCEKYSDDNYTGILVQID